MSDLYPFQRDGVDFLSCRRKAYLADEMGLGKTVQAIDAAARLNFGAPPRPVVIAPASVRENWHREWKEWGGPGQPTVVSHTHVGLKGWTVPWLPNPLIVDEAHYWKTPSSRRTREGLKLARRVYDAGGYVWLLSATPVPNDAREIYKVMRELWPELLPRQPERPDLPLNQTQFLERYCVFDRTEFGPRVRGLTELGRTELPAMMRTFMLRRTWADVELELPPLRVDLQLLSRDAEVERKIRELREPGDDPEQLATMRRLLGEYKAPKVAAILVDELKSGELDSVVVFHHHSKTREILAAELDDAGVPWVSLHGGHDSAARQLAIDIFQNQPDKARVFIVQQKAGGVGITLTRSHEAVLLEPDWSPAVNEQAIARIWRIGQGHPCRARVFAHPETLDEAIMKRLVEKSNMASALGMESSQ